MMVYFKNNWSQFAFYKLQTNYIYYQSLSDELFIFIFILLTRRKAIEALIHRQTITPTCFQRCQDIAVHLQINRDMTVI